MEPKIKVQQTKLHLFVSQLLRQNEKELLQYQSVIGMVYSLIEQNKLSEIDNLLRTHFPEYYNE